MAYLPGVTLPFDHRPAADPSEVCSGHLAIVVLGLKQTLRANHRMGSARLNGIQYPS